MDIEFASGGMGGGFKCKSVVVDTDTPYVARANDLVLCDLIAAAASITVTLPLTPKDGDCVVVKLLNEKTGTSVLVEGDMDGGDIPDLVDGGQTVWLVYAKAVLAWTLVGQVGALFVPSESSGSGFAWDDFTGDGAFATRTSTSGHEWDPMAAEFGDPGYTSGGELHGAQFTSYVLVATPPTANYEISYDWFVDAGAGDYVMHSAIARSPTGEEGIYFQHRQDGTTGQVLWMIWDQDFPYTNTDLSAGFFLRGAWYKSILAVVGEEANGYVQRLSDGHWLLADTTWTATKTPLLTRTPLRYDSASRIGLQTAAGCKVDNFSAVEI